MSKGFQDTFVDFFWDTFEHHFAAAPVRSSWDTTCQLTLPVALVTKITLCIDLPRTLSIFLWSVVLMRVLPPALSSSADTPS
jgi:hypothetical protein